MEICFDTEITKLTEESFVSEDILKSVSLIEFEQSLIHQLVDLDIISSSDVKLRVKMLNSLNEVVTEEKSTSINKYENELNIIMKNHHILHNKLKEEEKNFNFKNGQKIYSFYIKRIMRRIEILSEEINQAEANKDNQNVDMDCDTEDLKLEKKSQSNTSDGFDFEYKRLGSNVSAVQEQFDLSNVKKTLQTRLKNYKEAIDYCEQVGRPSEIIGNLRNNADKIMNFLKNYKVLGETEKYEQLLNIPKDISPIDLGINLENNKISEYITFVEQSTSLLNLEKQKLIKIMKNQNEVERK